jgi:hypothetical protein
MEQQTLVEELEEVSSKLDVAIEAGARGDWPRAEPCIADAKRTLSRILTAVERLNDIEKLTGG